MEDNFIMKDNIYIDVRHVINKLKITNKLNKRQYDYILLIALTDNKNIIFKFCYFQYYKKIEHVLFLIFDNCDAFWETKPSDTLYIRNIKRNHKLFYITNNTHEPAVQWMMTYREHGEFYANENYSYKRFFENKTKQKNIISRFFSLFSRKK